jgi:hypothetical protein
MTGYVRTDTTNNIADGNIINATDLDNEFDGVQAAFNSSTGHNHDGTTGEGAPILVLGPTQDVVVGAAAVTPKTTNTVDIGSGSLKFKDLFLAGNGSIGGTVAVTGVATLTAQPVLSSLTASSAVATDASKGLVSVTNTGTGNNVLATSPTLVTPILGTPTSVTLTNGTGLPISTGVSGLGTGVATALAVNVGTAGSPVVNGGVLGTPSSGTLTNATGLPVATGISGLGTGIATALAVNVGTAGAPVINGGVLGTPSSGTVTNLTGTASININGTVGATTANTGAFTTLSATGVTTVQAGTAAAPAITTSGDTNTGIFFPAADAVAATVGGTEGMRLTSTGLGIGTSSPSGRLTIGGYSSANQTPDIQITRSSSGTAIQTGPNITFADGTTNNTTTLQVTQGRFGVWNYGGGSWIERMSIDSSGNLGLGVTPSAWGSAHRTAIQNNWAALAGLGSTSLMELSSNQYVNSSGSRIYIGTGAATLYQHNAGLHAWYNAPSGTAGNAITFTQAMTLNASGNLGIGTSSPTTKLDVSGVVRSVVGSGHSFLALRTSDFFYSQLSADGIDTYTNTNTSAPMLFKTGGTERMRLDSSGNLGLGVTPSSLSPVKLLQVGTTTFISGDGTVSDHSSSFSNNAVYQGNGSYKYANSTQPAAMYYQFNRAHIWGSAPSGTAGDAISFTQAMTLNASGNLGLGVTPSAWGGGFKAIQLTGGASFGSHPSLPLAYMNANTYFDGTNNRYIQTSFASRFISDGNSGGFAWQTAPSGTAGDAISFTQAMTLNASGNLGIGTTSPGSKLDVSGTGNFQGLQVSGSPSLSFGANKWMTQQETGFARTYFCGPDASTYQGWEIYRATSTGTPVLHTVFDASGNLQMKSGANVVYAPAPASITAAATLTNANIQGQIIVATGSGPYTVTMPLGTTLETLIPWSGTNLGYDFTIINNSGDDLTVAVNTGVTAVGLLVVPTFGNTSAGFRIRRTAANTFVLYRLS